MKTGMSHIGSVEQSKGDYTRGYTVPKKAEEGKNAKKEDEKCYQFHGIAESGYIANSMDSDSKTPNPDYIFIIPYSYNKKEVEKRGNRLEKAVSIGTSLTSILESN
jgi:hypothetical protein